MLKRVVLLLFLAAFMAQPVAARDAEYLLPQDVPLFDECGQFWPSMGEFELWQDADTGQYSATLRMRFSEEELAALWCVAPDLKVEFKVFGVSAPEGWPGFESSTNLPGGTEGSFRDDGEKVAMPIRGIAVEDIRAGREYYATINFRDVELNGDGSPRISFELISEYHHSEVARVYLSDGISGGELLLFGEITSWEFDLRRT